MSKIKDGGVQPKVDMTKRIYQLVYIIATKFQRLYPCFRGRATRFDYCGDGPTCWFVKNWRWWPVTGSIYDISVSKLVYTIATILQRLYIPMFFGSGYKTRLWWLLDRRRVDLWTVKDGVYKLPVNGPIYNSQLICTPGSLPSSLVV